MFEIPKKMFAFHKCLTLQYFVQELEILVLKKYLFIFKKKIMFGI